MNIGSQPASQNSSLLEGVLDSSLNGIVALQAVRNADNKIVDFRWQLINKKAVEFYGAGSEHFIGKTLSSTLPDTYNIGLYKKYVEAVETGVPFHTEHFYDYNSLPALWLEISAIKHNDGVVITFSNITEKKKMHEDRENVKILSWIIESLPLPSWTTELNGHTAFFNTAYLDYTGLTLEQCLNHGWKKVIHPDDVDKLFIEGAQFLKLYHYFETQYRIFCAKENDFRWHIGRMVAVRNDKGEIIKWLGVAVDIHDLKDAMEYVEKSRMELDTINKELKLKNAELAKKNEELDSFFYIASHDLKAPVANLEGLLYTIQRDGESKEEREVNVDMMVNSVDRLKETIRDLTEVVTLQVKAPEDVRQVCFPEILDEVKATIKNLIQRHKAEIVCNFGVDCIKFSQQNAKSLLYNLLSNAIKYSSPERKPRVVLTTTKLAECTLLTVEDNGLGINKSDQGQVFGMFKRFHGHVEGSGIGLYIVKKMVENEGGIIELESEPGKGTTFKIYFRD